MNDIKYYADLASQILQGTSYETDKKFIKQCFDTGQQGEYHDRIRVRLSMIDNYYSTNITKRLYGLEDITAGIEKISKDDTQFKEKLIKYIRDINNPDEEIIHLFTNSYGIHKNLKGGGRATSLISKYAYFLTNYEFPIYDSLSCLIYPKIIKKYYYAVSKIKRSEIIDFFTNISWLNEKSGIKNYDLLDNLLWLAGKVDNASVNLLLSKDKYQQLLIEKADKGLRSFLQEGILNRKLNNIFPNDNQRKFIQFVFELGEYPNKKTLDEIKTDDYRKQQEEDIKVAAFNGLISTWGYAVENADSDPGLEYRIGATIFLPDDLSDSLMERFKGHDVPVKKCSEYYENKSKYDKASDNNLIFSLNDIEWINNDYVEVKYWTDSIHLGEGTCFVRKKDNKWCLEDLWTI